MDCDVTYNGSKDYIFKTSSSHALVRFVEKGKEEEMVVPANWVKGKKMCYPNSIKNQQLFKMRADPESDWKTFDIIKVIVTGAQDTCSSYNFTSGEDSATETLKSPSVPPMPASPVSSPEKCSPQMPTFSKQSRRVKQISDSEDESETDDGESARKRSKIDLNISRASPRRTLLPKRTDSSVVGAFPMDLGRYQYTVVKLLTEIKEAIMGNSSYGNAKRDIDIERMDTVEEVETVNNELINLNTFEEMVCALVNIGGTNIKMITVGIMSRLMTNRCMRMYSMKGRKGKIKLEDQKVYQLISDAALRSAERAKIHGSKLDIKKAIMNHIKCSFEGWW